MFKKGGCVPTETQQKEGDSMKIQVSWLHGTDITPNLLACSGDREEFMKYLSRDGTTSCFVRESCDITEDRERWVMTFSVPDVTTALSVSGRLMSRLRYYEENRPRLAPPAEANPLRQFVGGCEGDQVNDLNQLLSELDQTRRYARQLFHDQNELVRGIEHATEDLKKTRSDFMSGLVGGKIRAVRLALERLIGKK